MTKKKIELAEEWFTKGNNDLALARFGFKEGFYTDSVAVLIQQAVEKHLKGYLIYNGWHLKKTHDIVTLLEEAIKLDKSFQKYLDFGGKLSKYYVEDRYPEGPSKYPKEELESMLNTAEELIEKLKKVVKEP